MEGHGGATGSTQGTRAHRWARPLALALACGLLAAGCTSEGTDVANSSTTSTTAPTATTTAPSSTTATPTATTASTTTTVAAGPVGVPVELPDVAATGLVDRLVVALPAPERPPYVRDLFDGGGWDYDPASGCNTRERVLIEEAVVAPEVDDRCRSTGGRWRSAYDGLETGDIADLEIDHLVALAEAWRAGAWRWTPEERLAFANDLTSPDTLIAVSSSTNRSKGDSTPDQWLPPDRAAWCDYVSAWVRVKARWALTVTPAEKAAVVNVLSGC